MTVELFPSIRPEAEAAERAEALPMAKEIAWDYALGRPVYRRGRPVTVTGAEAVKVWIWRAIKTARCRFDLHTWDYGCEIEQLVGQPFTASVKESEAARYVREALLVNPYITGVEQAEVSFDGAHLTVHVRVTTIYGEVKLDV